MDQLVSLPHLPAEIVLLVVDFVSIDYILPFCAVCRSFRSHIDKHVFKSYLCRTTLIADIPLPDMMHNLLDDKHAGNLSSINASFSHVERKQDGCGADEQPTTFGVQAVFRLDTGWLDVFHQFHCVAPKWTLRKLLTPSLCGNQLLSPTTIVDWRMQLDHAVLDLSFDERAYAGSYTDGNTQLCFDWEESWTVRVEWRSILWTFLRKQQEITRRMHQAETTRTFPRSCYADYML
ncbi:hypothetical protein CC86DRAFT_34107 [Ophiobolus disseminans]|uniref:F-box domain-containing protein n=1 Tax=Ophiobolus disseminans TaxID=1469910 RepID=A0A6A6ZXB6_9PLEO|nr:hypothetical protein CC86DRAFT_34107 [Ophiobolus disseminans]